MPSPISHAVNITLFHEYPPQYASLGLANQNSGDILGDAFFVLRGFMLPVECRSGDPMAKFDCDNPEQNASTVNVVSQHIVTVDSRFGDYGRCNVRDGQYHCSCGGYVFPKPCNASVGRAEIATRYSHHTIRSGSEPWKFWRVNLARKLGGHWYSTTASGECTAAPTQGGACTWKVVADVRKITTRCLLGRVAATVIRHNATCFHGCPQPTNASSVCWVECLMATALGPDGGKRLVTPDAGIGTALLVDAWKGAFDQPEAGGCPNAYRTDGSLRVDEPTVEDAIGAALSRADE